MLLYKLALKHGHAFHKINNFDEALLRTALNQNLIKTDDQWQYALSTSGYCFLLEYCGGTTVISDDRRILRSLAVSLTHESFHPLLYALWDVPGHEVTTGVAVTQLNHYLGPFVGAHFDQYLRKAMRKGTLLSIRHSHCRCD